MRNYIATQTDNGFYIEFENSVKLPEKISFDDIENFAEKFNQTLLAGKQPELSEKEELILSLWEMILIPDSTIH
ncbi:MAG: hypothetical protein GTO02_06325 [Candidatus Dadabacteria bacterium]|nr:hypothetical protein [Candidatus Dadabacteria bacterium]NIQ14017.1 hypothetical protein [Candidatus Dadabacteria bacterium]